MKIHEYQAKEIFASVGIPVPKGEVAATPQEAQRIAETLGPPVMVKAQVYAGGRGKAGGPRPLNKSRRRPRTFLPNRWSPIRLGRAENGSIVFW